MNRRQQEAIEYLQEEVRVLQEQFGRRPQFNDDQWERLALKARSVGRKNLMRLARLVTLDSLPAWHRGLTARKYDSSRARKALHPRTASHLRELILRMARENRPWGNFLCPFTIVEYPFAGAFAGCFCCLRHEAD